MRSTLLAFLLGWSLLASTGGSLPDRQTLHGMVVDEGGKPVNDATVLIFHAGPKHGYSVYCPSCYVDCGKRAITPADGSFRIENLDPSLNFELLVVREGFEPSVTKKVDPKATLPARVVLQARASRVRDPRGLVRGYVTDEQGLPLPDVLVSVEGLSVMAESQLPSGKQEEESIYTFGGTKKGLENIAVSNRRGEFEVSYNQPAMAMLLEAEGRGYAPKWQVALTGEQRSKIVLKRGAIVRGRLTDRGKPVAGAEIGIFPVHPGGFGSRLKPVGEPYGEIRVGTQADGTFMIADVPTPVKWLAYVKAESMAQRGTIQPIECTTSRGEEIVNLGDLGIIPGHRMRGAVRISNGGAIPAGLTMRVFSATPHDSMAVPVHSDGGFEFLGLPEAYYDVTPETSGYREAEPVRGLLVNRDISDLTITLEAVAK